MAASTVTTSSAVLQENYDVGKLESLIQNKEQFALLNILKRGQFAERAAGKKWIFPVEITAGGAGSRTYATAGTNKAAARSDAFEVTHKNDFWRYELAVDLVLAGRKPQAFVESITRQMDAALIQSARELEGSFFRPQSCKRGALHASADTSSTSLRLANIAQAMHFEKDMKVVFAADEDSALRSATSLTVTAVNRRTGYLTVSATPDSLGASIAAGDVIFREGDYVDAGDRNGIAGLETWIGENDPTTSLFSCDRTVDPIGLGGCRVDGSELSIQEAVDIGLTEVNSMPYGGMVKYLIMNPKTLRGLASELASKVQLDYGKEATLGFSGFSFLSAGGKAVAIQAPYCPYDVIWGLTPGSLYLPHVTSSLLEVVEWNPGQYTRRLEDSDVVEGQTETRCNLVCGAPGKNVRIKVTTPTS